MPHTNAEPSRAVNVYLPRDLVERMDKYGLSQHRNRSSTVAYLCDIGLAVEEARERGVVVLEGDGRASTPADVPIEGQMDIYELDADKEMNP